MYEEGYSYFFFSIIIDNCSLCERIPYFKVHNKIYNNCIRIIKQKKNVLLSSLSDKQQRLKKTT